MTSNKCNRQTIDGWKSITSFRRHALSSLNILVMTMLSTTLAGPLASADTGLGCSGVGAAIGKVSNEAIISSDPNGDTEFRGSYSNPAIDALLDRDAKQLEYLVYPSARVNWALGRAGTAYTGVVELPNVITRNRYAPLHLIPPAIQNKDGGKPCFDFQVPYRSEYKWDDVGFPKGKIPLVKVNGEDFPHVLVHCLSGADVQENLKEFVYPPCLEGKGKAAGVASHDCAITAVLESQGMAKTDPEFMELKNHFMGFTIARPTEGGFTDLLKQECGECLKPNGPCVECKRLIAEGYPGFPLVFFSSTSRSQNTSKFVSSPKKQKTVLSKVYAVIISDRNYEHDYDS